MLRLARLVLEGIGLLTIATLIAGSFAFVQLASWLQYEDIPEKADFIFPLSGDGARLMKAGELYRSGYASKILLSNEFRSHLLTFDVEVSHLQRGPSEFQLNRLLASDVPLGDMQAFGENVLSTAEEAEALRSFLGDRAVTVILVTSPYQARRAKIIFEYHLPRIKWLIVHPDQDRLPSRWWRDKDASLTALTEIAKLTFYLVGGVFRGPKAPPVIHAAAL